MTTSNREPHRRFSFKQLLAQGSLQSSLHQRQDPRPCTDFSPPPPIDTRPRSRDYKSTSAIPPTANLDPRPRTSHIGANTVSKHATRGVSNSHAEALSLSPCLRRLSQGRLQQHNNAPHLRQSLICEEENTDNAIEFFLGHLLRGSEVECRVDNLAQNGARG